MKRILTFILGTAVTVAAAAQDWQDARFFAENNYVGTARTLGMGNAVTAIGGDPGSISINPAGSSVASYSQFVISPGFTLSTTNASGVVAQGNASAIGLGDAVHTNYGRFTLPNVGAIFTVNTGRRSGWKRTSFGFVLNATNNYTGRFNASGVNADNSYAASLASSAEGYSETVLGSESWWYDGGDIARMPKWVDMMGYRAGMFNGIPGDAGRYQAITEVRDAAGNCWLAAPLYQKYGQQSYGNKYDVVFNFSADYEDKFYIGINLGLTSLFYRMSEYFSEAPDNPDDFPVIEYTDGTRAAFNSLQMKHSYTLRGNGVYVKAGLLWRPLAGLRLGAAVQSPTIMSYTARQAFSGEVLMTGKSLVPSTTPEDSWTFRMQEPWRFNVGAAYSFGSLAVLSADYELASYKSIRYRASDSSMPQYLSDANADIQDALGMAHQLRVGVEVKPTADFSLRAGYNLVTYGQRNWLEEDWSVTPLTSAEKMSLCKHNVSVGAGYSFGSFFLDAAFRFRIVPKEYMMPYHYYGYDSSFTNKYVDWGILTPEVEIKPNAMDIVLTAGWRF